MLYLYPTTIGDDVLDAMAEWDKVCRLRGPPLQHAADPVLKRKRPGTRASYERCSTGSARASRCHAADDLHLRLPRLTRATSKS